MKTRIILRNRLGLMCLILATGITGACASPAPTPTATPTATIMLTIVSTLETPIAHPTDTPVPTPSALTAPSWRGITPGQTTREEVLQRLGEPNFIQTNRDLECLNYYPSGLNSFLARWDSFRIVLRQNVVQLIIAGASEEAALTEFTRKLGEPETVINDPRPIYANVYVFATHGMAIEATGDLPGDLRTIEYFLPMTTAEYLKSWGQYHPKDKPFPAQFPGHPIEVGIVPGRSTRQDVQRLYGAPDYAGSFAEWGHPLGRDLNKHLLNVYVYRIPQGVNWKNYLGGELYLSFVLDDQEVVQLVHIQGSPQPGYRLKDVFAKYGEPDWIYEETGFVSLSNPAVYFYPEKGLSVVALSGNFTSPSNLVQSEWFFPPMSWDEYWSSWGAEPRSGLRPWKFEGQLREWKGFPKP